MSTIKSSAENLTLNADGANNDVIIQSNGSTKVTVDGQNSRVGIGTTAPAKPLEIKTASDSVSNLRLQGQSGFVDISGHGGNGSDFVILPEGTEKFRITEGGDVKVVSGNLVIATAGKGIDFSANSHASGMSSELLDSYEEGTWTVTDQSGANMSLTVYVAMYTKIGRKVFFEIGMAFPTNSSTAIPRLSLPFTAKAGGDNTGAAFTSGTNSGREGDLWLVSRGQAYFQVGNHLNADTHSTQAKNNHYSGKQLKLCGSYTV